MRDSIQVEVPALGNYYSCYSWIRTLLATERRLKAETRALLGSGLE